MQLRPELFPPVPDENLVRTVSILVVEIERALAEKRNYTDLLNDFSRIVKNPEEEIDNLLLSLSNDFEAAVRSAITPRAPYRTDLSDEELLEIIRLLKEEDLESYQWQWFYDLVRISIGMHFLPLSSGTPSEILAEARAYKPISL